MAKALSNMQHRPEIGWTVESLAHASGLSRATFARRFTDLIGQPPLHYLTRRRMDLAKQLLVESDLPISVIAGRVGYSSEFAFGKAFAREVGSAPGGYRRTQPRRRRPIARRRPPVPTADERRGSGPGDPGPT
jgi:transcriptional regulator GlxA family with amidase domain